MFSKNKKTGTTDEQKLKRSLSLLSWAQEYTKKIVAITFWIFVISNLVFLGFATVSFIQCGGEMMYFNTFVTEIHQTFRDVIGGYIIKAAMENIFKIGGSYMEGYINAKYHSNMDLNEDGKVEGEITSTDNNSEALG